MSSYHKPKTYRSLEGCCICKAKSSSSRFTDSDKYEDEFENCFLLPSGRGEKSKDPEEDEDEEEAVEQGGGSGGKD